MLFSDYGTTNIHIMFIKRHSCYLFSIFAQKCFVFVFEEDCAFFLCAPMLCENRKLIVLQICNTQMSQLLTLNPFFLVCVVGRNILIIRNEFQIFRRGPGSFSYSIFKRPSHKAVKYHSYNLVYIIVF